MKIVKRIGKAIKRRVERLLGRPNNVVLPDRAGFPVELKSEILYHRALSAKGLNNSTGYLQDTLLALLSHYPEINLTPVSSLAEPGNREQITVSVRVDACSSLSAAVVCSSIYSRYGVPNSVFLNHTAPYFMEAARNPGGQVANLIAELSLCGSEVGLHTDFFGISSDPEALKKRLQSDLHFVRSLGVSVEGTVSHNSAWSYGVENFRVFSDYGRVDGQGSKVPKIGFLGDFGLKWDGSFHRETGTSRAISPAERGLGGVDAVRSRDYLTAYFLHHPSLNRGYDFETWLLAEDAWVFADLTNQQLHYPITREEMLVRLLDVPQGSKGVMLIHPEYVSLDIETSCLSPFSGGGRVG